MDFVTSPRVIYIALTQLWGSRSSSVNHTYNERILCRSVDSFREIIAGAEPPARLHEKVQINRAPIESVSSAPPFPLSPLPPALPGLRKKKRRKKLTCTRARRAHCIKVERHAMRSAEIFYQAGFNGRLHALSERYALSFGTTKQQYLREQHVSLCFGLWIISRENWSAINLVRPDQFTRAIIADKQKSFFFFFFFSSFRRV